MENVSKRVAVRFLFCSLLGTLPLPLQSATSQVRPNDPATQYRSSRQINKILSQIVGAQQEASQYDEWEQSKHHPENLFELLDIQLGVDWKPNFLCGSLLQLRLKNLALFEDVLVRKQRAQNLNCRAQILSQITEYFRQSSLKVFKHSGYERYLRDSSVVAPTFGPSEEVTVSTKGGPRFIYGDLKPKELLLTFDDGPHYRNTPNLLQVLRRHKVRAIFFMVGKKVMAHPLLVTRILSEGHVIANHSQQHKFLPDLEHKTALDEIRHGFYSLLSLTELVSPFFRFPFGARNLMLKNYLKSSDVADYFWSIDTLDWKKNDPMELYEYALEQTETVGRGIVLFHDIQPQTHMMMSGYLFALQQKGYKSVIYQPEAYLDRNQIN